MASGQGYQRDVRRPELLNYYQLWLIIAGAVLVFVLALVAFVYYRFCYLERRRRAAQGWDWQGPTRPAEPAQAGRSFAGRRDDSRAWDGSGWAHAPPPADLPAKQQRQPSRTSYHSTTSYSFQPTYHVHTSNVSRTVTLA